MPISFAQIPSNIKVPLYWVEVDPSKAGLPTLNLRALLVGCMNNDGAADVNVPVAIGTLAQAQDKFGAGSELAQMFGAYFQNNFANEVWAGPVMQDVGAAPATGTIKVKTSQTEAGTIHLYIAGHHVGINIGATDTPAEVATSIATMINGYDQTHDHSLPVTAVATTDTVTLTATFDGVNGNDIRVELSYFGNIGGERPVTDLVLDMPGVGAIQAHGPLVGGSAYTPGSYHNVPMTGGTGTGARANIVVSVGGAVTNVSFVSYGAGYTVGDSLSATAANIGGTGTGFSTTVTTIFTSSFLSGGVGVPTFDNLIIAMGEQEFEYIAVPYTDSTSLLAWDQEMGFSDSGRWGWQRQHFGHCFSARRGNYSDLVTYGLSGIGQNSGVISIMAFELPTPTPMYEMAAAYTAKAQRALSNDPARPLQTLQLVGTLPAKLHDRFNFIELNSLASSGLAIQKCWEGSGMPQIAREQTTYLYNLYGQGDDSYELVTTLATLAKLLRNQRHAITSKYPRHKLANDGTRFSPGQAIVTPGIIKAELVAQYRQDEWDGLVEDTRNFKRFLLVERDSNNPNRVNVLYPPDLINQLRIFAVLAQFRLQYDRGIDVEIIGYTGLAGIAGPGGARLPGA
jgi:phage tail sheath gpL-like